MRKFKSKIIIVVILIIGGGVFTEFTGCNKEVVPENNIDAVNDLQVDTCSSKGETDLDRFFDKSYYSSLENKAKVNLSIIFGSNQFKDYVNSINSLNDCFRNSYINATRNNHQLANEVNQYLVTSQNYLNNGDTANALNYYGKAYTKLGCASNGNILYKEILYPIPFNSIVNQSNLINSNKLVLIENFPELANFSMSELNDLVVFGMLSETINYNSKSNVPRNCEDARNSALFSASVTFAACTVGSAAFGFPVGVLLEIACTNALCYQLNEAQWAYTSCKNNSK